MGRLYTVLTGGTTGAETSVRAAMVSAAIGGAVMHPLVMNVDDDTLRSRLLSLSQQLLDLPEPGAAIAPGAVLAAGLGAQKAPR